MIESIIKGSGLGLILAISVGPVIFTILKQSINNGQKGGFSFVAGVWLSDIILVVISNMFSSIVVEALAFKNTIGYTGAAFVISLGVYYLFFKKVYFGEDKNVLLVQFGKKAFTKAFMSGFLINTLNPSVMLFWLINATAFAASHNITERVIIFGVCLIINMVADVMKVMLASKVRHSLTPHNIRIINKISGTILILFGAAIVYGIYFLNK
ncbi:MAG: LysE family translocator [bacterium]|jgi:threonine/homoserine/homoserine lactone efflux protein